MRTVVRPGCSREQYGEMVQQVLDTSPYGLVNQNYRESDGAAILLFWDSDYIPPEWQQWIVRPASFKSAAAAGIA